MFWYRLRDMINIYNINKFRVRHWNLLPPEGFIIGPQKGFQTLLKLPNFGAKTRYFWKKLLGNRFLKKIMDLGANFDTFGNI